MILRVACKRPTIPHNKSRKTIAPNIVQRIMSPSCRVVSILLQDVVDCVSRLSVHVHWSAKSQDHRPARRSRHFVSSRVAYCIDRSFWQSSLCELSRDHYTDKTCSVECCKESGVREPS